MVEAFQRLSRLYSQLEKHAYDFGTGEPLYPAEIHTVDLVGREEGITVGGVARTQGTTRGAASQLAARLREKGLVERVADHSNRKQVRLALTESGRIAFENHRRYHAEMDGAIMREIAELSDAEYALVRHVLERAEHALRKHADAHERRRILDADRQAPCVGIVAEHA